MRNRALTYVRAFAALALILPFLACGGGPPTGPDQPGPPPVSGVTYKLVDARSDQPAPGAAVAVAGRAPVPTNQSGEATLTDLQLGVPVDFTAPGCVTRKETVGRTSGTVTILLMCVDEQFLMEAWYNAGRTSLGFAITMAGPSCVTLPAEMTADPQIVSAHQEAVDRLNAITQNPSKRITMGACAGTPITVAIDRSMRPDDWYAGAGYNPSTRAVSEGYVWYGSGLDAARQANLVLNGLARALGLFQPSRPSLLQSFYARQMTDFTVDDRAVIRGLLDRGPGTLPPDNSSSRGGG